MWGRNRNEENKQIILEMIDESSAEVQLRR